MACLALALCCGGLNGQESNHYLNGTSGLNAGTLPPPGNYWLIYNYFYNSDRMNDGAGHAVTGPSGDPLDVDIHTYANAHRFVFVTDKKILGADYAWNFVVPFVMNDVEIKDFGVRDSSTTFADLYVEPFVMEWHQPRYDFGFLYGFIAPTGRRDSTRPSLPGKNCWTNYFGFGATYYFDEERTWTASMLSRYEVHGHRLDQDVTAGNDFSFEWGFAKKVAEPITVGVSGYCAWQITGDRGTAVVNPGVHDRAFAIGPELQTFFPELKLGLQCRSWWEFGVRDRPVGHITTVTFVKPF